MTSSKLHVLHPLFDEILTHRFKKGFLSIKQITKLLFLSVR